MPQLETNSASGSMARPKVEAIDKKRQSQRGISPDQRRGLYISVMIREESPATVARRADISYRDLVIAIVEETEEQCELAFKRRRRAEIPRFWPLQAA